MVLGTKVSMSKEQEERFDAWIDDNTNAVKVFNATFMASEVLREVDPIAYRQAFLGWLDAEDEEEE